MECEYMPSRHQWVKIWEGKDGTGLSFRVTVSMNMSFFVLLLL